MNVKAQNKLKELIDMYSKKLPDKIHRIETLWKEQQHQWNLNQFQDFHREVHSLCGSSGTYGYIELSKAAREMEIFLKNIMTHGQLTHEDKNQIVIFINQLKKVLSLELPQKLPLVETRHDVQNENKVVYILEQDKNLKQQLYESLQQIDYEPFLIQDLITLSRAVEEKVPAVIILDTHYLNTNGIERIVEFQKEQSITIQLLCIVPNADIMPRLEAIRAGCSAFFQKPVDVIQLIHILNYKCSTIADESYRILIIDDSESLAEYYSLILNQAGMNARAITNPLNLLRELESFKPNLLLMDVYMPECTGFELAAILRQESLYTKIPIIFLSTEDDKDKKLFAISLGGDDFLTKPISPQHLISAVRSRSKRASILNYYMTTDSLSGLLNHSSILNQLDIQLAKARQDNLPLSFIMIDIDHFKKINDSYGHPVGDRVIKKLASLFLSRMRSLDNVGRYGGEEFALILPGASPYHSKIIADNLREQFSQCRFSIENEQFNATFSAGVSFFDGVKSGSTLVEQADQALYQAKQSGRNLVVIFDK